MIAMHSVLLSTLVKDFHLDVVFSSTDYDRIRLTVEDVSRPGLQIAGYFDHFEPMRLQVLGNVEASYIERLSEEQKLQTFDRLFGYKFPALLVARGNAIDPVCLQMAKKHNVTVLSTNEATSTVVSAIIAYLKVALAHGKLTGAGAEHQQHGNQEYLGGEQSLERPMTTAFLPLQSMP